MVFSSIIFLFYFLPALLLIYFIIPKQFRQTRNIILLIFSLAFYAYGEPKYVFLMIASILINYFFGFVVEKTRGSKPIFCKTAVWLSVISNLGILIYFKYTGFILSNLHTISGISLIVPKIIMPIGISFFTFQGMSYVLDVFFDNAHAQKNPLNVALYITLFPQLIAGPIVRYETIAEQINDRHENLSDAAAGICRFAFGLGKKIIIANSVGLIADTIFAKAPADMAVSLAWVGMIAYTLQIYFDFSGYSDMAIGLGKIFGFHFLENFDYPYISCSITEFWRRWHISLGTWFRDYVYIPLGGNRVSVGKHIRNILVVWLLTGIWHGAAWNFIIWGLYFGVILLLEKFFLLKKLEKAPRFLQHGYALLFIMLGWVLFRSPNMLYAWSYIKVLFGFGANGLWDHQTIYFILQYGVVFIIAIIASTPITRYLKSHLHGSAFALYHGKNVCAAGVFALAVIYLINSSFNPFIYFRF